MASSTLKTMLGFVRSMWARRTPFGSTSDDVEGICNYLNIESLFATSGQPDERQFELIREAGFETVVNLAPESVLENSLIDEASLLAGLGLEYIHIPVDFKNPTQDDFDNFVRSVQERAHKKIWVHCAANMRVSAFVYKYRCSVLGEEEAVAKSDLDRIWEPFGVWKSFLWGPGTE